MPSLSDRAAEPYVKLMYIGDSGTGKTGSLTSLVKAGYNLRILDMDNNLEALVQWVKKECPDRLSSVEYETFRDEQKMTPSGPMPRGGAKAFTNALKMLDTWSDGTDPAEWGSDHILVIDTLTAMGDAAFNWAKGLNPTAKDKRQWFFSAQQALEAMLAGLTSAELRTNVIICSHIRQIDFEDGSWHGFPSAIGSALSRTIARFFPTLILAESQLRGKEVRRTIRTIPTPNIDLKNPIPFKMEDRFDLGDGMAKIFEILKGD